ncbi:MAG TPA: SAM-dependent chlorinase/fluorinase [Thermoanaerobaculia bacterium]|nr:SAM-dependent chlorinase/fluorinase [Thermoanaerobaculia bacterium]
MAGPGPIALITDFGWRDSYVAAMKGVLVSRASPGARVLDLTHEIALFDIFEGAWFLRTVAPFYPQGTIFVIVVDPGVGSSRRIVAAELDGRFYLAPDNGVLSLLGELERAVSVENEAFFLPHGSTTFHGRDRFAPVAAALSNGTKIDELGPALHPNELVHLDYTPPRYDADRVEGSIVAVDRFGNIVTDIEASRIGFSPFAVRVKYVLIEHLVANYAEGAKLSDADAFLVIGSGGLLEISTAKGSASEVLHLKRFEVVEVMKRT